MIPMDCTCIPFAQIPQVSRLFTDYLDHFARVSSFFRLDPFQPDSYFKAAETLRYEGSLRQQVVSVLREQNRQLAAGEKTLENLAKLEQPDCFAVVTGQQVGLFTGPAFALYKALTAIKLARQLSSQGLKAVPVFWLATEDHDLEEVNHCFIRNAEGIPQRLDYTAEPQVMNAPVGSLAFTDEIQPLLEPLQAIGGDSSAGREVLEKLALSYRPGESFGSAFGRFLAWLFSEFGVVLADQMDPRLHQLSAGIFREAIESADALREELMGRNRLLGDLGYHLQVRVAENSSLLFLCENGQRTALRTNEGQFITAQGSSYSSKQLLDLLERQPESVSPNVLLRPIMQDALLPTLCSVAGPSELAYLAQAGVLHERLLGRTPVIFPRASLTILEAPIARLLRKYDLSFPDTFSGKQSLREKMAARFLPPDLAQNFQKAASDLQENLDAIQKGLVQLDPTLAEAAAHSGRKMQYQLSSLGRKAASAIQGRTEQIEYDALRLENNLYPHKMLQERFYSGISFLARYGPQFLDRIYEQISLSAGDHRLVTL
ncbi:MAG: bacillithiol biosynthesis cysteine-adding enzyme BshC [Acidobacteria bacterium]|nr:bacillithiol biosynthesis cysteine-adding enzyme BshC [Acidobacteriota bacterium]